MARPALLLALLAALSRPVLGEVATLPIATFRLELTIKNPFRNLLRGGERGERALESVDDLLRPLAESHLSSYYSRAFPAPPSRVLLTVTADPNNESDARGIHVRSSFLGGVASFPASDAPRRIALERATLAAFAIPGAGEAFLEALGDEGHPELEGLLLLEATEVDANYDDDRYTSDAGPADSDLQHDEGGSGMNVWAVAAVAALGAMFLVIVTCTSILYCDWRKRKTRRQKRRERSMAAAAAARERDEREVNYRKVGSNKSESSGGVGPPQVARIVVAHSGDTEVLDTPSPTTQGSNEKEIFVPNNASISNKATSTRGSMFHKMRSSRPSLGHKRVRSKAADLQLQDAAENASNTPSSADLALNESSPSVMDHSVGEDTTMLYPTINRGRLSARSAADDDTDFDGYSIDGMSGIASGAGDGFSSYGGSATGMSSGLSTEHAGAPPRRDMHPSGEAPRDFDSVWGEEATLDGGRVRDADKGAYGDLTKNLDELVERVGREEGSQSKGSVELDSGSEPGSTERGAFVLELIGQGPAKGSNANAGSASPGQDEEDSILGDMYRDEAASNDGGSAAGGVGEIGSPGGGDSVDSTPSWAAPIQSALRGSMGIFRETSPRVDENDKENDDAASNQSNREGDDGGSYTLSTPMKASQNKEGNDSGSDTLSDTMNASQQRTKEKFVSSLSGSSRESSEDGSVGSHASGSSAGKSNTNGRDGIPTAKSSDEKALGLTNSLEEEVDEDPAAMIDNINSMLSECREILDTEQVA